LRAKPAFRSPGDPQAGVARVETFVRDGKRLELYYGADGLVAGALLVGAGGGLDPVRTGLRLAYRLGPPTLGNVDRDAGLGEAPAIWLDPACDLVLVARLQPREWWNAGPPETLLHVRTLAQTRREDTELAARLERLSTVETELAATVQPEVPSNGDTLSGESENAAGLPTAGAPYVAGSGGVSMPVRIPESYVEPEYPELALRMSVEARVVLEVVVRRDGIVEDVQVLEDSGTRYGFEAAAVAAARRWRYRPATLGGLAVDAVTTAVVDFRR
jgi:protein TonB